MMVGGRLAWQSLRVRRRSFFTGADSWFPLSVRKICLLRSGFESRACFEFCLSELP